MGRLPCQAGILHAEAWTIADKANRIDPRLNRAAANLCNTCPIRAACEQQGVDGGETGLIWGGRAIIGSRNGAARAVDLRDCAWCGRAFVPNRQQRYCTSGHAAYAYQSRRRHADQTRGLVAA